MDYIYQGPIILVLLVSAHWELGQGWAPGGQQRTHPAEMLAKDVAWSAPPPAAPQHTLCTGHPHCLAPGPSSPFPSLHTLMQLLPLAGPQVLSLGSEWV